MVREQILNIVDYFIDATMHMEKAAPVLGKVIDMLDRELQNGGVQSEKLQKIRDEISKKLELFNGVTSDFDVLLVDLDHLGKSL